jgi:hypothetical protein
MYQHVLDVLVFIVHTARIWVNYVQIHKNADNTNTHLRNLGVHIDLMNICMSLHVFACMATPHTERAAWAAKPAEAPVQENRWEPQPWQSPGAAQGSQSLTRIRETVCSGQ